MTTSKHVRGTLASLALCTLAAGAHAAPTSGSFDMSWGAANIGKAQIPFDLGVLKTDNAAATVLDPDGSMYIAGTVRGADNTTRIGVAKLDRNGILETDFSGDGRNTSQLGGVTATGIALSADGKRIYVSGFTTNNPPDFNMVVCAFSAAGGNAINFPIGGNTPCTSPIGFPGTQDIARDIAVRPDGKIVIVGTMGLAAPDDTYAAFAQFEADGSPDTGFGNVPAANIALVRTMALYEAHDIRAVALAADGRVVGVGTTRLNGASDLDGLVITLEADGTPASLAEAVFDEDGTASRDTIINDVTVLAPNADEDAAIAVVGSVELLNSIYSGYIGKLFVNGGFDLSGGFGGDDGATIVSLPQQASLEFTHVASQADGRLVVLGQRPLQAFPFRTLDVMRFSTAGQPDASFGIDDGHTIIDFATTDGVNTAAGLAVRGNEAIHVAAYAVKDEQDSDFFAAKLVLETFFSDGFEQ